MFSSAHLQLVDHDANERCANYYRRIESAACRVYSVDAQFAYRSRKASMQRSECHDQLSIGHNSKMQPSDCVFFLTEILPDDRQQQKVGHFGFVF